jgi:hypothetical protein
MTRVARLLLSQGHAYLYTLPYGPGPSKIGSSDMSILRTILQDVSGFVHLGDSRAWAVGDIFAVERAAPDRLART